MKRILFSLGLASALGCSHPGLSLMPDAPRAVDALPARCGDGERARPLVVDWRSADRADFTEAMQQGVVAVRYDCDALEVLPDCHLPGTYSYLAITPEQAEVELSSAREVRVNLPVSGAQIAANMAQGAELRLSYVTSGKHIAQLEGRAQPRGACARATHYVRGIYRGAFEMDTGVAAETGGGVHVHVAGSGAQAQARRANRVRSGDPKRCTHGLLSAETPPEGCDVPLELELRRLRLTDLKLERTDAADATDALGCPEGFVELEGRCHERAEAQAYACNPSALEECAEQCERGNLVSCARQAYLLLNARRPLEPDLPKALALYERACAGGVPHGCAGLGFFLKEGLAGAARDLQRAFTLERAACDAGEARGCNSLGTLFEDGVFVATDYQQALRLYQRACESGLAVACANEGDLHARKLVAGASDEHAAERLQRACLQESATGCERLSALVAEKRAAGIAAEVALISQTRECDAGFADACSRLAAMLSALGKQSEAEMRKARACQLAPTRCEEQR